MVTFAAVSLILTVGLGVVLTARIQTLVNRRSVDELTKTTQSAIALTAHTIATGLAYGQRGEPLTTQQQQAQVGLISAASRVLVANSGIVAVDAALPNGFVIGGSGGPRVGTVVPLTAGFRAVLAGATRVQTLDARSAAGTPVEARLLRRYGSLLRVEQGVHLSPRGPVVAVVQSYAPLAPTQRQAAADVRSILWVLVAGLVVFWVALFRLVLGASRALTRHARENMFLVTHDSLTGLPNRPLLHDRTTQAVLATRRSGLHVGLVLIDLDRFKEINDTLGHPYGDMLLKQIGPRLRRHLRDSDTVARLGGDEFVVLLPDLRSPEAAFDVAEKLAADFQEPFDLDGVMVDVDSSAGVATTPGDGSDFDELLQHADVAMYVAKRDGLAVVAYAPELDSYSPVRLTLLADLRRALDHRDEIVLHYQPQADLATRRITGVEALVRWQHPEHGMLEPDSFIPLAEHSGIIRPLTRSIMHAALRQNRRWADEGLVLRVSVNVSARCLLEPGFSAAVGRLLEDTGVPADRLELELTESAVMTDPDRALGVLEELAAQGIWLSIDDFGTGYSSMAYIKRLPVHQIKIDRSFVTHMDTDAADAAIVRTSLDLARHLNLTVVAEGVETPEVWQQLTELGCPAVQGYYLSLPLPPAAFAAWMAGHADDEIEAGAGAATFRPSTGVCGEGSARYSDRGGLASGDGGEERSEYRVALRDRGLQGGVA